MTKDNYMALADIQEIWTNKQKPYIGQNYATKDELNAAVVGATAAELFTFEVDIATMQLHVYSTASYANAFKIEDGTLKIDLSAMPTT